MPAAMASEQLAALQYLADSVHAFFHGQGFGYCFSGGVFGLKLKMKCRAAGGSFGYVHDLRKIDERGFSGVEGYVVPEQGDLPIVTRLLVERSSIHIFRARVETKLVELVHRRQRNFLF